MKLSIITATKNNKQGLLRAIECVRNQTFKNIEHIIVDGGSTDGSVEILRQAQNDSELKVDSGSEPGMTAHNNQRQTTNLPTGQAGYSLLTISEPDSGIYDAINKGIKLATGDVIGLLHSDDLYADEQVLERYAEAFNSDSGHAGMTEQSDPSNQQPTTNNPLPRVHAVYSDLVYVKKKLEARSEKTESDSGLRRNDNEDNTFQQPTTNYQLLTSNYSIVRNWKTGDPSTPLRMTQSLKKGWMPPHPTLFVRKEIFEKYGLYRTDMKIAADYEMILRLFLKHKITSRYLPVTTYLMTLGGASNKSMKNIFQKSKEDLRAMKLNGISFPYFTLTLKNLRKIPQFLVRSL